MIVDTESAKGLFATVRDAITSIARREPAAVIGAAISIEVEVQHALTDANVTSWRTAVPVLVALFVRQFVYSPASVDAAAEEAAVPGA